MTDFNAIRALIDANKLEDAREQLVDHLYEDYDNLEAWLLLTECAVDAAEYARAVREALRIAPDHPQARRLAMELAQEQGGAAFADKAKPRGGALRSLGNLIIFFIVISAGAGLVFYLLQDEISSEQNNTDIMNTPNPEALCAATVNDTLPFLAARCSVLDTETACLANPDVFFQTTNTAAMPTLLGDRIDLQDLAAISVGMYDQSAQTWGLAVVQSSERSSYQLVLTSGVTLSQAEEDIFEFRNSPVQPFCDEIAPSGILLRSLNEDAVAIQINGLQLQLIGVAFLQINNGQLHVVMLAGESVLHTTQSNISSQVFLTQGQWISFNVDANLMVDNAVASEAMVGEPSILGDLGALQLLSDGFEINNTQWQIPSGAVAIAIQPTITATRGIRIPTATATPTITPTPRYTATSRPTRTPTQTLVPTSTDIPVFETTPNTPTPTLDVSIATDAALSGTWQCTATIDILTFTYILSVEPLLQNDEVFASAILPEYQDAVIALRGVQILEEAALDADWVRLPNYQNADVWLLLQETEVLYPEGDDSYSPNGTLRLFYADNQLSGGIFEQNRFIGIIDNCQSVE